MVAIDFVREPLGLGLAVVADHLLAALVYVQRTARKQLESLAPADHVRRPRKDLVDDGLMLPEILQGVRGVVSVIEGHLQVLVCVVRDRIVPAVHKLASDVWLAD